MPPRPDEVSLHRLPQQTSLQVRPQAAHSAKLPPFLASSLLRHNYAWIAAANLTLSHERVA